MGRTPKTSSSLKLVVGEKGVLNSQVVVSKYLSGQKIPQPLHCLVVSFILTLEVEK
jgi:hypothetical protein